MDFYMHDTLYPKFDTDINSMKLIFLETGYLSADSDWHYVQHLSPFNRLFFIISGIAYLRVEGLLIEMRPGNCYMIPAGCVTDYMCDDYMEMMYHHFNIHSIIGRDYFYGVNKCLSIMYEIAHIFKLLEKIKEPSFTNMLYYQSEMLRVIGEFADKAEIKHNASFQNEYSEKAVRLFHFIEERLNAQLRVQDCAKQMNMSIPALTKLFRDQMGETLNSYLESLLMQKIQYLILTTAWSLKEISSSLKFSDQYYFSRFFKNIWGLRPANTEARIVL